MGPKGFPPNMSHYIMFQTTAQSDKKIQSYWSGSEEYQNGVLIVAKVNVL